MAFPNVHWAVPIPRDSPKLVIRTDAEWVERTIWVEPIRMLGLGMTARQGSSGCAFVAAVAVVVGLSALLSTSPSSPIQGSHSVALERTPTLVHGSVLNPTSAAPTVTTGPLCTGVWCAAMAYDSAKGEMFVVANNGSSTGGRVLVVNDTTNTIVADIPLGVYGSDVAYDPVQGQVWAVGGDHSGLVSIISDATNTVVNTVWLGGVGSAIVYDSSRGEMVVANTTWSLTSHGSLTVINDTTDTTVAVVALPTSVYFEALAYDSGKSEIFGSMQVFGPSGGNVTILDDASFSFTATVPVPLAAGLAYDPVQGEVWVASPASCTGSDSVHAINDTTNTVSRTVTVGSCPLSLTYDALRGEVFVANEGSDSLSVIRASDGVAGTVPLGSVLTGPSSGPKFVAYDPRQSEVFVTSAAAGDPIVLVPDNVPVPEIVTFVESGLPSSTNWTVVLNGTPESSLGSSISFAELNGTYSYTVWADADFGAPPSAGTVTVAGAAVSRSVPFVPNTNDIIFSERGLPVGATWAVTLGQTENNTTVAQAAASKGRVEFGVPDGTEDFVIHPSLGYGVAAITGPGNPTQTSGVVAGGIQVRWNVVFGLLEPLLFNESTNPGLQLYPGADWAVSLIATLPGGPPSQLESTNGTSISFTVPASASYRFAVTTPGPEYKALPFKGGVHAPASSFTKTVKFKLLTAAVVFKETGLVSTGRNWSVAVTGTIAGDPGAPPYSLTLTTTGAATKFKLAGGSYSYTVTDIGAANVPIPASGSFSVAVPSSATAISITFS